MVERVSMVALLAELRYFATHFYSAIFAGITSVRIKNSQLLRLFSLLWSGIESLKTF